MKKIFLMIICCLTIATTKALAQDNGKIFLQHNGVITNIFDNESMSKAIEAAAEGDTIFLSSGRFMGDFTINKSISIIGTVAEGNNYTYFDWSNDNTYIKTSDSKSIASVTFEGIQFSRQLYINSDLDNLIIKKCYFQNGIYLGYNSNSRMKNAIIDRSRIDRISMGGQIESLTVKNCKINNPYGNGGLTVASCKYINCNIRSVDSNTKAMFVNSIINNVGNGTDDFLSSQSMLVNTLYHNMNGYDPMEKCSQQDCWSSTETLIQNNGNCDCTMTSEQLKAANYLGTDGTVVGIEGGVNPYTLERHIPIITQKGTKVDLDSKKVIINVNVTAK